MLKTWPTKAGPLALPFELSPPILTADEKPELDSAEETPLIVDLEETESDWGDSNTEVSGRTGESANLKGTHSLGGEGGYGAVLGEGRRKEREELVAWRRLAMRW